MLTDLSVKKLLSIALSIAWVDFAASQKCVNCQCCSDNFKSFLLYGILPVAIVWTLYGVHYYLRKDKKISSEACDGASLNQITKRKQHDIP